MAAFFSNIFRNGHSFHFQKDPCQLFLAHVAIGSKLRYRDAAKTVILDILFHDRDPIVLITRRVNDPAGIVLHAANAKEPQNTFPNSVSYDQRTVRHRLRPFPANGLQIFFDGKRGFRKNVRRKLPGTVGKHSPIGQAERDRIFLGRNFRGVCNVFDLRSDHQEVSGTDADRFSLHFVNLFPLLDDVDLKPGMMMLLSGAREAIPLRRDIFQQTLLDPELLQSVRRRIPVRSILMKEELHTIHLPAFLF